MPLSPARASSNGRPHFKGVTEFAQRGKSSIFFDAAENLYPRWPEPICIVSDGPYGVGGFPGDPPTVDTLEAWYRPHVEAWSQRATPQTTLWFWNTELGWATVHPLLLSHGWEYRCCHVWDKGLGHVAGNANSQTLRKFPVVTEVCVQYIKTATFTVEGRQVSMRDWLRHEWQRSGLPMYLANKATGTVNAATRKYLTADHLWYYPPVEAFQGLAEYANRHGRPEGCPYFSIDGKRPISAATWSKLRAKFFCEFGVNNVWREPPVRGTERLKRKYECVHNNQKPLRLIEICLKASSERGDVVWEPFGGLCTVAVAAHALRRTSVSAEVLSEYYLAAKERLMTYDAQTDSSDA